MKSKTIYAMSLTTMIEGQPPLMTVERRADLDDPMEYAYSIRAYSLKSPSQIKRALCLLEHALGEKV